jgi:glycerol dehydrogenase-like iron-containing ADH family enzyme
MDSGSEHHHPEEQIPTEYTEEQTLRTVRKQSQIHGVGRKEKTINDFPKAAALGQILKDLDFPADKQTIVNFVKELNTPQSREILPMIEKLNEKSYESVSEIANATGLVE